MIWSWPSAQKAQSYTDNLLIPATHSICRRYSDGRSAKRLWLLTQSMRSQISRQRSSLSRVQLLAWEGRRPCSLPDIHQRKFTSQRVRKIARRRPSMKFVRRSKAQLVKSYKGRARNNTTPLTGTGTIIPLIGEAPVVSSASTIFNRCKLHR